MWTPSERSRKACGRRALRAAAILLVLAPAAAWAAPAPQPTANPPASAEERGELRRTLESRYEVLPVSGGIALKPIQARAGIRTIEVTGQDVAVNGERVSPRTLRDWLGEDADLILRLKGLSAGEQRRMFGLEEEAAAPGGAEQNAPEQAEQEVSEVTETPGEPGLPEQPPLPPLPPRPGRYSTGDRVNVGGSVTVDKGDVVNQAVAVGGSVHVDEGAEVREDVAAIGGPARIDGKVGGDVVSVGSSVYLGPHAEVGGGVTTVGGRLRRAPGAVVEGPVSEVSILPFFRLGRDHRWWHGWDWERWGPWSFWGGVSDVLSSLMHLVLMGLLTCLVLLVARRPLERVDRQLAAQPWPSAFAGLMGFLFFWPLIIVVTVLLAITFIGCALFLLYPFLFLYLGLLLLLGYAAAAYRLGRWIEIRFNRSFGGPYAVALVGVFLIQIWSVFGHLLDLIPGPFWFFSFMVGMFGFLVQLAAWIVGFGAVILARFGTEPGYWPRRGAPVPPPPPAPAHTPAPDQLPLSESRWEEPGTDQEPYPPEGGEPR
jgi:hypothetical protein